MVDNNTKKKQNNVNIWAIWAGAYLTYKVQRALKSLRDDF